MPTDLLAQLELVKRLDGGADVDVFDLRDWLKLPDGWIQASAEKNEPVNEVLTLNINASSVDDLASILQDLDEKVLEIDQAQEAIDPFGVWLRAQLTGETNARQAYLLRGRRSKMRVSSPALWNNGLPEYTLGLTRMSAWENTAATTITSSAISAHGGTVPYTVAGDTPARIAKAKIVGIAATYNEAWFGVKSDRYGVNPANFVPIWALNYPLTGTDTTRTVDATAVSGYKCVTTFATLPGMSQRVYSDVITQSANYADQRGKYTVLLRAKITDASLVANVRVGSGFGLSAGMNFMPPVEISGAIAAAGWRYYTLGTVKIPAVGGLFEQSLAYATLSISAEKILGSGNLETDCILLIPAENRLHVLLASVYSNTISLNLVQRPDRQNYAITYYDSLTSITESALPDADAWSLPSGSGVIVCATQSNNSALADQLTPTFTVYPSYASMRGAA